MPVRPNIVGDLVPTIEIPIPTVNKLEDLDRMLAGFMGSQFPGFVANNSILSLDSRSRGGRRPTHTIIAALHRIGHDFEIYSEFPDFSRQEEVGVGDLHVDVVCNKPVDEIKDITVHKLLRGVGVVLLGEAGPYVSRLEKSFLEEDAEHTTALSQAILSGQTDPKLILPIIYTARVTRSDVVIFADANHKGPVPHRFDTLKSRAPRRAANIFALKRVKSR